MSCSQPVHIVVVNIRNCEISVVFKKYFRLNHLSKRFFFLTCFLDSWRDIKYKYIKTSHSGVLFHDSSRDQISRASPLTQVRTQSNESSKVSVLNLFFFFICKISLNCVVHFKAQNTFGIVSGNSWRKTMNLNSIRGEEILLFSWVILIN